MNVVRPSDSKNISIVLLYIFYLECDLKKAPKVAPTLLLRTVSDAEPRQVSVVAGGLFPRLGISLGGGLVGSTSRQSLARLSSSWRSGCCEGYDAIDRIEAARAGIS